MQLYLVRHAKAVARSFDVLEEHRYLTPEGREEFRSIAHHLGKKGMDTDVIVSSPFVRAVQTAEILAEGLACQGPLLVDPLLQPGFGLTQLKRLLTRFPGVESLACVGHEPDLGETGAALLGLDNPLHLSKGAVLALRWDAGGEGGAAHFLWMESKGVFYTDLSRLLES